eukprot:g5698.t1
MKVGDGVIGRALAIKATQEKNGGPLVAQPWSQRRNKVVAKLEERNVDASVMDEDWWEKHIKGANSKLDATCRKCEVRVTSTSLSSFMHQGKFGCGCRSKAPWSQRRDEVIAKLEERNINASVMDEDWWEKHIKGVNSKLDATCRKCEARVTSTPLNSFMHQGAFGCGCRSKAPWSQRRDEVIARLEERNINASVMDEDWWKKHIKGANSMLDATCRKCEVRVTSTSLSKFMHQGQFGCGCRSKAPWSQRRDEVIAKLEERNINASVMDEDWWEKHIKGQNSMLDATCRKCEVRVTGTSLSSFMHQGAFGCGCRSKAPWSQRRDEVIAKLEERNINASVMGEDWWKKHIKGENSMLDATCLTCNIQVTSTTVKNFMHQGNFGCGCHNKTETKFHDEIETGIYPLQEKAEGAKPGHYSPPWLPGGARFDFGIKLIHDIECRNSTKNGLGGQVLVSRSKWSL